MCPWKKKSKNLDQFIMSGGSLSLKEWINLSEEEKKEVINSAAGKIDLESLIFMFHLTEDKEKEMIIAKTMRKYDGGKLYKLCRELEMAGLS